MSERVCVSVCVGIFYFFIFFAYAGRHVCMCARCCAGFFVMGMKEMSRPAQL